MTIANTFAPTLMEAIIVLALRDMSFRVIKLAVKVHDVAGTGLLMQCCLMHASLASTVESG